MPDDDAPPPSLRSMPASSERLVGTMVDGRYVLKREIGRGGICAVYAAEHRYTRRTYALKALLPEYRKHQEARARLLAEARLLGAVEHPNVVEVTDAGMDDGSPFIVMERLRAKSVEALLLARGKLTVHDALVIGRFAAAALAATHTARVVHRDVKPGNLLVVRTPTGKSLKLIDFGVATPWEELPPDDDSPPSAIVGTPYYMAPEHLGGRRVTPAVDVYSFGATMYECLTGSVPFSGSFEQVYARAMTQPRPDVRQLRPDAPAALADLVARCLSADARERYPTGVELSAAIEAVQTKDDDMSAPQVEASRRGHVRVAYRAPIEMKLPDGLVVEGAVQDISVTGLLVTTNHGVESGTAVTLRFPLPSGLIVASSAVVRWHRASAGDGERVALGLELVDLETPYKQAIADYVRSAES
jgi:serine/threonine protein kinase